MRTVSINLPADATGSAIAYLHHVTDEIPRRKVRPCVVVCPGGGYQFVSARENEPIAMAFFAAGYHVAVLTYSIKEAAAELRPLRELSQVMIELREHAGEWGIDPKKIAVIGFSAGGHLAASLATLWDAPALRERMDTKGGMNRPDAAILSYAVITASEKAHRGSIETVSGGDPQLVPLFSLENQVTRQTPPTFIWHTGDDPGVPVENALLFANALRANAVPFEMHIFETGAHGLSLANEEVGTPNPRCQPWFPLCLSWLGARFDFTY